MKIFLIGFMGVGKSTIGKKMASLLGLPFIDSDRAIENQTNKTVAELFSEKGESHFRELEQKWLQSIKNEKGVFALGGGTPCTQANIELINQLGTSVYLLMDEKMLAQRLINSKNPRPLIQAFIHDSEQLTEFIQGKLSQREIYYKQAKITFDAANVSNDKLKNLIHLIQLSS